MLLGIDRFVRTDFNPVRGMELGLLSSTSSCDSKLDPTISLFLRAKRVKLNTLFAPEHGLYAALQDQVAAPDTLYGKGLSVRSMYGKKRKPGRNALKNLDAIVIDLLDIGTRYYTFVWSAMLMVKEAAAAGKKIFLLDRPNPLNGLTVQGPLIEAGFESFVGLYSIPVRHGMTIGEICTMLSHRHGINADLRVVKLQGWRRDTYFDENRLEWTVPSPNMPHFTTALVYPGMCLLEGTNVSEGRGTTRPFETFGAPWIDPGRLVRELDRRSIRGIGLRPTWFVPTFHKFRGELCGGAQICVTNRHRFDPLICGLEIVHTIRQLYPKRFSWRQPPYEFEKKRMPFDILLGNSWVRQEIEEGTSIEKISRRWMTELREFRTMRKKYLLYS
ncbi:MAG: DUF1343 domain-containing protein [candidate division WOR-3 bacterium]|nr:MAG: DUF1343 domain-containing protein [candidate division WOR-3 bacterium]